LAVATPEALGGIPYPFPGFLCAIRKGADRRRGKVHCFRFFRGPFDRPISILVILAWDLPRHSPCTPATPVSRAKKGEAFRENPILPGRATKAAQLR